jgi:hypothetical protein
MTSGTTLSGASSTSRPTFDAAGNITNLAGTPGGGRYGFGALNTVRTAARAGGPRQIQFGAKFYF